MANAEKYAPRRDIWSLIGAAIRHGWWLAAIVIILVSGISAAQYVTRPRIYRTQQALQIVVLPIGAATTYDQYQATVWEETIGHALTERRLTTVIGGFAAAINSTLATDMAAGSPHNLSESQFQQDLAWTNYGNSVILTAYWTTPAGATALLDATIGALIAGDLTHLTILRGAIPASFSAFIATNGSATAPNLDPGQQIAAQQALVAHIVLSIVAGVLLLLGWEWLLQFRISGQPAEPAGKAQKEPPQLE